LQLSLNICGVSGSRRHGNTLYLVERALRAASVFFDEMNVSSRGHLKITSTFSKVETGFDKSSDAEVLMSRADGLLLASPVYFGSISPSLNQALKNISRIEGLSEKSGACVTIGTQRNGGQETAIEDIYRWFMARSVTFVGNGPVTSQYGGTVWGGAIGTAENDEYGLHTTEGTGKRLAQDVLLRAIGKKVTLENSTIRVPRFLFFCDSETPQWRLDHSKGRVPPYTADYLFLKEDLANVEDCVACATCPPGNLKEPGVYGCIFNDDLNTNYERFYSANTIICSANDQDGLCSPDYWKVLNRMRSVRRNNYDLTGRCGAMMGTSMVPLKWLIRNNLPIVPSEPNLMYRESLYRMAGLEYMKSIGMSPWTEPTIHE
jgi:multimeric flavodoxin WrbA